MQRCRLKSKGISLLLSLENTTAVRVERVMSPATMSTMPTM